MLPGFLVLVMLFLLPLLHGETTIDTLGGGPLKGKPAYGYADGSTLQEAQFNNPFGCALDITGRYLYVADRDNNSLRILDIPGDLTRTLLARISRPVAVVVDATNNLYVVSQGTSQNGAILFSDIFGDTSVIISNLTSPSALALDGKMNLFVTELSSHPPLGSVKRFSAGSLAMKELRGDLLQPAGIAVTDSGLLAVTEMANHTVKLIHPDTGEVLAQWGSPGIAGFHDGYPNKALFNQPQHIAKAPNGNLVVADRRNHRVRVINANSIVTTLYGIDSTQWGLSNTNWPKYPGWLDGSSSVAESHDPVGVAVAPDGTVYGSEVHYHIIRKASPSEATGSASGTGGGSTNVIPEFPILDPTSGYFPMGQTIKVTDPNTNLFVSSEIYYTTDGTEPTTNSIRLLMTNHVGLISWSEPLRDLTSLRVKVFLGNNNTATISGRAPLNNYIGIHRDLTGGSGACVIIPIVLNLRSNQTVQSLQYRVEVTPNTVDTPPLKQDIQALDLTTNSFVRMAGSSKDDTVYVANSYRAGETSGIWVTFQASFANFEITEYGAAGLIAVPIPPEAIEGNQYTIRVRDFSATSDAGQSLVPLTGMPVRTITVQNVPYLVGDSTPGVWYNAGDFGRNNGEVLDNADANAVFYASLGYYLPHLMSDVYDAMDAFPEDVPPSAGGDGHIRYLDWQTIFFRSLRLPEFTRNYYRSRGIDGSRISWEAMGAVSSRASSRLKGLSLVSLPEGDWFRPVQIRSLTLEQVSLNSRVSMPVFINVKPGFKVAGLQFHAVIEPGSSAPQLDRPVEFVPSSLIPSPAQRLSFGKESVAVAWNVRDFRPALQGSNLLGYVRFTVPSNASPGHHYRLRFSGADGAPDFSTQYDFETISATAWVLSPALSPDVPMSVEWITNYFGRLDNPLARPETDADQDGVNNLIEYARGTSPVELRLHNPTLNSGTLVRVIQWFGQQGKTYALEVTDNLLEGPWTILAGSLAGANDLIEVSDTLIGPETRFYRVRIISNTVISSIPNQSQTTRNLQEQK